MTQGDSHFGGTLNRPDDKVGMKPQTELELKALSSQLAGMQAKSIQLPRVIILVESLYGELSSAADRGVGELRLMTLGNQGSS